MPIRFSLSFLSSHVLPLTESVLLKVLAQGKEGEVGVRMVSTLMIKSMARPCVQLPEWVQWEQCPCATEKGLQGRPRPHHLLPLTGIK